jgi:hypothetical protein
LSSSSLNVPGDDLHKVFFDIRVLGWGIFCGVFDRGGMLDANRGEAICTH